MVIHPTPTFSCEGLSYDAGDAAFHGAFVSCNVRQALRSLQSSRRATFGRRTHRTVAVTNPTSTTSANNAGSTGTLAPDIPPAALWPENDDTLPRRSSQ